MDQTKYEVERSAATLIVNTFLQNKSQILSKKRHLYYKNALSSDIYTCESIEEFIGYLKQGYIGVQSGNLDGFISFDNSNNVFSSFYTPCTFSETEIHLLLKDPDELWRIKKHSDVRFMAESENTFIETLDNIKRDFYIFLTDESLWNSPAFKYRVNRISNFIDGIAFNNLDRIEMEHLRNALGSFLWLLKLVAENHKYPSFVELSQQLFDKQSKIFQENMLCHNTVFTSTPLLPGQNLKEML